MTALSELRRKAADRREAANLAAEARRRELLERESPSDRVARLAREAEIAELELGKAERVRWRRAWRLARFLAFLAAFAWIAWRIGYESGLVAALGRACAS